GTSFGLANAIQNRTQTTSAPTTANTTGLVSHSGPPANSGGKSNSSGPGAWNSSPSEAARTVSAFTRRSLHQCGDVSRALPRRRGRSGGVAAVLHVDQVRGEPDADDHADRDHPGLARPARQQPPEPAPDDHAGEEVAGHGPGDVGEFPLA